MIKKPIYLDYNATTPVDPQVLEVMWPYFTEKYGNAASIQHMFGWEAEEGVDLASTEVADLIGAKSGEIIFTSGATASINMFLDGVCSAQSITESHIITCVTEHKAVLDCCDELEKKGATITRLGVDSSGLIDFAELEEAITDHTRLIAIMHANNELGVLQPIREIAAIGHKFNIPIFSDATQSVGKIPMDVRELNVDAMAFSSHKLYGPKGVGALYINKKSNRMSAPMMAGGGHAGGFRSGTLNVPGIVGFGKACQLCQDQQEEEMLRLEEFRGYLENELGEIEDVTINGKKAPRLAHVSNISFRNIDASRLIRLLKGLAVSQGSACTSSVMEPSHVLKAIGLSDDIALGALRISLGRFTTMDEVKEAVRAIKEAVEQLRFPA
jgi:cysteine desulfurase